MIWRILGSIVILALAYKVVSSSLQSRRLIKTCYTGLYGKLLELRKAKYKYKREGVI